MYVRRVFGNSLYEPSRTDSWCDNSNDHMYDLSSSQHRPMAFDSRHGWRWCGISVEQCKQECENLDDCAGFYHTPNNCCFPTRSICDGGNDSPGGRGGRTYVRRLVQPVSLQSCSVLSDAENCQWVFERSPTREDHVYIKVSQRPGAQPLYLHALGHSHSGDEVGLDPCPKADDRSNCQWQLETACQDHRETAHCRHWASLGMCQERLIGNSCPLTCNRCVSGSDLPTPWGEWVLLMSSTKGAVQYTISEGVGREDGTSLSEEQASTVGRDLQHRIQQSVGFSSRSSHRETHSDTHSNSVGVGVSTQVGGALGGVGGGAGGIFGVSAGVETNYEHTHEHTHERSVEHSNEHSVETQTERTVGMSWEHTNRVAQEISHSISQTSQTSATVSCDEADAAGDRSKVWLYQWLIHDGPTVVRTAHTRCHYTDGTEHAPECPFTACGLSSNEWCELHLCSPWQK